MFKLQFASLLVMSIVACGKSATSTKCTDGATVACACAGSGSGVQTCTGGALGACACGAPATGSSMGSAPAPTAAVTAMVMPSVELGVRDKDGGAVAAEITIDGPGGKRSAKPPSDAGGFAAAHFPTDFGGKADAGTYTWSIAANGGEIVKGSFALDDKSVKTVGKDEWAKKPPKGTWQAANALGSTLTITTTDKHDFKAVVSVTDPKAGKADVTITSASGIATAHYPGGDIGQNTTDGAYQWAAAIDGKPVATATFKYDKGAVAVEPVAAAK